MSDEQIEFSDGVLSVALVRREASVIGEVRDVTTGRVWGPCNVASLEVYDKMQLRTEPVDRYEVVGFEKTSHGAFLRLATGFRGISIGIMLELSRGEMVVTLAASGLVETNSELYRLMAVELFPGLMKTGPDGVLILPINTGAICRPMGKPKVVDRFLIYGEQERWELLPTLPVCAAHSPTAGGLIALATGVPHDARCRVETDGQGTGTVGFGACYRQYWSDPVDEGDRVIRYSPLHGGADPVVSTAKRVRRHVVEDHHKPTLEQRIRECPQIASVMQSYTMKLFYGVQPQGIMINAGTLAVSPELKIVMSFAEAQQALSRIHAAGIERVYTQSTGWNTRGHDGLYPTRFPVEERLGGEAGFRDLIEHGKRLGYLMHVHDNHRMAVRASPDFDVDTVVHDVFGEPLITGCWGGGITYARWAHAIRDDQIQQQMHRLKGMGLSGMYYLDDMGNPLYRNYHPAHRGPRSAYAQSINRFAAQGREVFGSIALECGYLYCALGADMVSTAGKEWMWKACKSEWPITSLLDQRVPVWQLAMHGLVMLENQALGWPAIMRCVLMGDHPRFEWATRPGLMPVLDDALIGRMKAMYDIALARFGHLQLPEMQSWTASADGTETTQFDDGTQVVADFKAEQLFVNGEQIQRPLNA